MTPRRPDATTARSRSSRSPSLERGPDKFLFNDAEYRSVDFLPGPACQSIAGFMRAVAIGYIDEFCDQKQLSRRLVGARNQSHATALIHPRPALPARASTPVADRRAASRDRTPPATARGTGGQPPLDEALRPRFCAAPSTPRENEGAADRPAAAPSDWESGARKALPSAKPLPVSLCAPFMPSTRRGATQGARTPLLPDRSARQREGPSGCAESRTRK